MLPIEFLSNIIYANQELNKKSRSGDIIIEIVM